MLRRILSLLLLACVLCAGELPARADESATAVDEARARVAANDTAGAIAGLAVYVAAHPTDGRAGRLLGDLYFRVPDYKRAEVEWKRLIALDPLDRDTHNRLGGLYAALDRTSEAIAEFEKSLPTHSGFLNLVEAHRRAGDLPDFEHQLALRAQRLPDDVFAQLEYGQVLRILHRYDDALVVFRRLAELRPRSCPALVDLSNDLLDLGRIDDAMVHLKACLAIQPNDYAALVDYGEAYIEKSDLATARPFFEHARAVKDDGSEALVDIGYIEDAHGNWKDAIAFYQRAIAADPLQADAYIDLGFDYYEHDLFTLAEATFLKGISAVPLDGRLHYLLGVTYNVQGKIVLARAQYHSALGSYEPIVVRAAARDLSLLPAL